VLDFKQSGLYNEDKLKKAVENGLKLIYPIASEERTLKIDSVDFGQSELDPNRWKDIKDAIVNKKSITIPVNAKFTLTNNESGDKISTHKINIADLPIATKMGTYVVKGNQYNMPVQMRLKSGAYGRISDKGEAEIFNNIDNSSPIRTQIDTQKEIVNLKIGQGRVPIYPVLKVLGMDDNKIRSALGDNIFNANAAVKYDNSIKKTYKAIFNKNMEAAEDGEQEIRDHFGSLTTNPNVNKRTLGKKYDTISADYLLDTAKKVIGITKGTEPVDNRDALIYKDVFGVEDIIEDSLKVFGESYASKAKTLYNMKKKDAIGQIVDKRGLQKQIEGLFTTSKLSRFATQSNPIAMRNAPFMTTLLGDGGIRGVRMVSKDAKVLQNSHMGFIDATHTPQSSSAGITLSLARNVKKEGRELKTKVINLITNKTEWKSTKELFDIPLAFPGEFKLTSGKWKPESKIVTVIEEGHRKTTNAAFVKYMIDHPSGMFDIASNLIPFSHSNQGNRMVTGAQMGEQVISLENPEVPLVDVFVEGKSLTEEIGKDFSVSANNSGIISKVTKDFIVIDTPTGRVKQDLFGDIPLNDHAVIESRVKVKVGDKIKKGQLIADSNFTKDGQYAIGVNLTTAYLPWKGYNFEDGIVITEGAANKMTSVHMHKKTSETSETEIRDLKRYKAYNPYGIKSSEMYKYDNEGVIKKGTKLKKDDIVIASMREHTPTGADTLIAKLKKSAIDPFKDTSVTWHNDFEGEVTDVAKHKDGVNVFIKTKEPFQTGDKIVGRHGNKGVVTLIIPDEMAPITESGEKVEVLLAPDSVPPRINVGQIIETAAGKIAAKTKKPFKVENYSGINYQKDVLKQLDDLGIKEKENIIDPETGTVIPDVFVGKQYIQKLKQQIDTKISARGISEGYTLDNQPATGGGTGGQAIDRLTSNALLAYNARNLISEMSNIKNNSNDEYWRAIQHGELPPAPTPSFEWKKFEGLLKSMGVNTIKKGDAIKLAPLTDKDVLSLSNGEITDPGKTFIGKGVNLTPNKDGLFGNNAGGLRGEGFNHITLNSRIPSPAYKDAIKSVLHLTDKEFEGMLDK
jgi:DNA-directed RNA polymerase beta subunit